ncbi:MAG TPA: phospholipase D-like domain-containing protein [Thermoanaerobaculia bacterium]|nr:phospholipase D-like domain-containing protein [Thermoanaerobaculia bacterium]
MSAPHRRHSAWLLAAALALTLGSGCTSTATKRHVYHFNNPVPPEDLAFRRSLDTLGNVMVKGNRAELLENGDQIFPAMIKAIEGAKRTVALESYIFSDGRAGSMITNALLDAARRGVEVRVLIDGTGGHPGALGDQMKKGGVDFRIYHPVRPWNLLRIGQRTHRKILVVDGTVCFTGGLGIEDRWLGNARNPNEWRDTQVEVWGPVAEQMQAIFGEDWTYTTGEILAGDKFYPPIEPAGNLEAQAVKVSRGDASSLAKMLYYVAIQSAAKTVHIQNAYFLPDPQIREALVKAVQRGVDVRIMVPGKHIDVPLVRMASRHHYGELLEGGVKIYEYLPTMMHTKAAVFDGIFAIIGSINFDTRSMEKNAEESITFYDRGFAAKVEAMFGDDMKRCREIDYDRWRRRDVGDRLAEVLSGLWTPFY